MRGEWWRRWLAFPLGTVVVSEAKGRGWTKVRGVLGVVDVTCGVGLVGRGGRGLGRGLGTVYPVGKW